MAEIVAARNGIDALHFVPARSLDVADPPRVDVVVAEVLGNFAYEEDVLETLRDAQRFLAPGGTLIPQSIVQWAAPVTTDRFERDLRSWRDVGFGLDWSDAERMTRNNMYVFTIEPGDLVDERRFGVGLARFPRADREPPRRRRRLAQRKHATIFGFALWWECTLAPGVVLSTSPYAPRTHWDQIYLPLLEPLAVQAGDDSTLRSRRKPAATKAVSTCAGPPASCAAARA